MHFSKHPDSSCRTMGFLQSFLLSYPELLVAIVCFLSFSVLRLVRQKRKSLTLVSWPVVGMLPFLIACFHSVHDNLADALRKAGCTFMFHGPWFLGMDFLLTCDPATVNHCFNTSFHNYPKGPEFADMFDILGNGILVADADSWVFQRRVALAIFGTPFFRSFATSTMARLAGRVLIPFLEHMAKHGLEFELEDVFMRFTLDVTYSTVFAADLDCLSISSPIPLFGRATKDAEETMLFRHIVPPSYWKLLRRLNLGREKKMAEAKVVLDHFIYQEIARRKEMRKDNPAGGTGGVQGDLLTMYMNWPMEPGMSEHEKNLFLRDTAVGFIFGGKDLIAVTLTWLFYMILKHPHVEAKILEELRALGASTAQGKNLTVFECDVLRSAVYLHATLLETLRLFPAVPFEEKEARSDDVLPNGTKVAKGTRIIFSLYAMARMEAIWGKDCMEFRPERWISKRGKLKHEPTYKYLAFNTGPRSCLGKDLALTNMKITAAAIVYNFQVELVGGHVVKPQNSIILHTQNGMKVRVKRRHAAA